MTDNIECVTPDWVNIPYSWKVDDLITNDIFSEIIFYLSNVGIATCKFVEHLF